MHPSFVDIENEFAEIAWEADHLSNRLARIGVEDTLLDMQEKWEATHVCASAAEKIYTGCERVMARLATEVDHSPVAHSDGWHAALLRRMANPFPLVRDAIISKDCYAVLDKLRAFRHRKRNTYGIHLDFDIVVERGHEAMTGFALFREEVRAFLSRGNDDDAERNETTSPAPGRR
jgi:hypothetical protein